ncbi:MAG: hypothetical protein AAFX05_15215 [Planctomycetota bacterium]
MNDRTLRILAAWAVGIGVAVASFCVLGWLLATFVGGESDMIVLGAVVLMVVPLMLGVQIGISVHDRISSSEDGTPPSAD